MVFIVLTSTPKNLDKSFILLEHRAGIEPANTGFADQRVSHFAIGAFVRRAPDYIERTAVHIIADNYFGCAVVRRYGFTVL